MSKAFVKLGGKDFMARDIVGDGDDDLLAPSSDGSFRVVGQPEQIIDQLIEHY